ncbi:hypothetical protein [Burkholderia sp. GS2Y]|uniref:Uncharacterized protein n=1 Tax=Burkholderia theae TaxID=3143496 RepID=A0ABU9WBA5_9BURK
MLDDDEIERVLEEVKARSPAKKSISNSSDWVRKRTHRSHSATVNSWTSGVCFPFQAPPSFWKTGSGPHAGPVETRYAYCILIEVEIDRTPYLFIQRLNAPSPVGIVQSCARPPSKPVELSALTPWQFLAPWIEEKTRIEKLSMRPMALNETALRRKILEARDVKTVMSTLGIQTTIPGSIQVFGVDKKTRGLGLDGRFRLSPKQQRIAEQSGRLDSTALEDWVTKVASAFHAKAGAKKPPTNLFRAFAQPATTLVGAAADSLLVDCQTLWDRLEERRIVFEKTSHKGVHLRNTRFLDVLDESIGLLPKTLARGGSSSTSFTGEYTLQLGTETVSASVSVHKTSVTCTIAGMDSVSVYDRQEYGEDRVVLSDYISRERLFRVAFDGGKRVFAAEGVFAEADLAKSSRQLLQIFSPVTGAPLVTSEKGSPTPTSTVFPKGSSFRMLVDSLKPSDAIVCDDSTDEWCDFVSLTPAKPKSGATVSWFHAKVKGTLSGNATSASNLQDVIGQAVKNLGRLRITSSVLSSTKRNGVWARKYVYPKTHKKTNIDRFMPHAKVGTLSDFIGGLDDAASDPRTRYRVCIVVPTLSRQHIRAEFAKLGTSAVAPEVVQLFWILSGFMQSCLEVHAQPVVMCRV